MPSEETMQRWDHWRKRIADGCTNSSPRDWFEGEIDNRDERIAELETLAREWCIWNMVNRHGCTQVQAERIMKQAGHWPREAPSDSSITARTIRALAR